MAGDPKLHRVRGHTPVRSRSISQLCRAWWRRAAGLGVDVHFAQMNAEHTPFPNGHFDLVVSHILLHETSGRTLPSIFDECFRLLAPGGWMIHADVPRAERRLRRRVVPLLCNRRVMPSPTAADRNDAPAIFHLSAV